MRLYPAKGLFKGFLGAHTEPSDVFATHVGVASESGGEKATDGQESPHLTVKLLSAGAHTKQLVAPMRKRCRQNKTQPCDHRGKTSKGGVLTLDLPPRGCGWSELWSGPLTPTSQGLRTQLRSGTLWSLQVLTMRLKRFQKPAYKFNYLCC